MSKFYKSSHHDVVRMVEDRHFWFAGRKRVILRMLQAIRSRWNGVLYMEVGVGTGELIPLFSSFGFSITGLDINKRAIEIAKKRCSATFVQSSFLTYTPKKKFQAIGMFDVLEHIPNDRAFIRHARSIMTRGGYLFLTVPAGMWLWNNSDVVAGHIRRYDKKSLGDILRANGFTVVTIQYWNFFLLPVYWAWRLVTNSNAQSSHNASFVTVPPEPLNSLFGRIVVFEAWLMHHCPLPVGASLLVCAKAA